VARGYFDGWAPYVPVSERRRQAAREAAALKKKGQVCQPVTIGGRAIATTFWGKAWCDNLEAYSDFANRLPRGRTYVRNGSVIDLRIEAGKIVALVSGSELYRVEIAIDALDAKAWQAIVAECSGRIGSLIEMLQGRLSKGVMEIVTRPGKGLFPAPRQMRLSCSCPDSASMCKHVAASLYGVGTRLDDQPELLFRLRHVDAGELIAKAIDAPVMATPLAAGSLAGADLSALFGIELADPTAAPAALAALAIPATRKPRQTAPPAAKPAATPARARTITAAELLARGIPRHMVQAWLGNGVLRPGKQRGIYMTTRQTEPRIDAYLSRDAR